MSRQEKKLSGVTSLIRAQFEAVHITECGFMTSERCPLWRSVNAASVGKNMMMIIIKNIATIPLVTTLIQICTLYRNGCLFKLMPNFYITVIIF